jgi:excinuclease UvrABC ATPase subunit
LKLLLQKGFTRIAHNGETANIETLVARIKMYKNKSKQTIRVLVDRLVVKKNDEDLSSRVADRC